MPIDLRKTRAGHLLDKLQPYIVAPPYNMPHMNLAPFGLEIPVENQINPMAVRSELFLDLLQNMDAMTFGPEGMPMSRWVFYDASELPGGIFGFGIPSSEVSEEVMNSFGFSSSYEGLVPFSMYIAIPTPEPGTWFGHNLSSLNSVFPQLGLKGLGTVTKALALEAFGTDLQVGATQWDSSALFIHTRFGPLDLETAYTPAHSTIETLTYRVRCTEDTLGMALGHPGAEVLRPEPEFWVHIDDEQKLKELQRDIELGAAFCVPDAPRVLPEGKGFEVPVAKSDF